MWKGVVRAISKSASEDPTGIRGRATSADTLALIGALARLQPDERITGTINLLGRSTAHVHTWSPARVCAIRSWHETTVDRESERQERGELTVDEVATALKVTPTTVLRLIRVNNLVATQLCRNAPWTILRADLEAFVAARAAQGPSTRDSHQLAPEFNDIRRRAA